MAGFDFEYKATNLETGDIRVSDGWKEPRANLEEFPAITTHSTVKNGGAK